MADVGQEEGFLQKQLECGVCLVNYHLKDHVPMALFCQHTFCNSCVDTMAKKPPIKCPKCIQVCEINALCRNFALCDVLDKMCEFCRSSERAAHCEHCNKRLCSRCLESHVQTLQGGVRDKLGQLRQELKKSAALTVDETVLDMERAKAVATIETIQKSIAKHQKKIKKLKVKLNEKVTEMKKLNIKNHMQWQDKITAEIGKCKQFLASTEDRIATTFAEEHSTKTLTEINEEAVKFLNEICELQKSPPSLTNYKFVESKTAPDVGGIISQPARDVGNIVSQSATISQQPAPDYMRVRTIAVRGGRGSGREEFAFGGYVTCTDDRYIVSDADNHRVKVYDKGFNLLSIFGEKSKQTHQFRHPNGLCVSSSGDLYVCDSWNHRVKVYDEHYQLIRTFGSRGSGNDHLKIPHGLALTHTGELLVADSGNYRVKVMTIQGSFIRNIGSKGEGPGQFSEWPRGVAVTLDNHVLVSECNASRLMMFRLDGQHVRDIRVSLPKVKNDLYISDVTVDRIGNIVIADRGNNQLIVLNDRAEFVCVVGKKGDQSGKLKRPWSVAVNSNNIIVYEEGNHRIHLFGI